tara:strand:+ start:3756 stop:4172 length:417 start_codon:yes stop_codon:yes gene_type:complete
MPYSHSVNETKSSPNELTEFNAANSTENLRELIPDSTQVGQTQRYERLCDAIQDYVNDSDDAYDLIADVKRALYELQDYYNTQLHKVEDSIVSVHSEQHHLLYSDKIKDVTNSRRDWDDFWYNEQEEEEPLEHTSEGC